MCGICGVAYADGRPARADRLRAANDLLRHRGPDDEGCLALPGAGLAMRRLAIIDLATGHQPLSYAGGKTHIVFNGEIYNYRELRADLETRGHRFRTKTDTETILALYEESGPRCVERLRGMFAFAIWDERARRLTLARDRLGKKPLCYHEGAGVLAFASELRALFELADVPRDVDPEAVDEYLTLQYVPAPGSVYARIKKLPPGHLLVYEKGAARVERYWDLPLEAPPAARTVEDAKRLVAAKVEESVRARMVADVPLGAFLSGGVDSSVVVALMARHSPRPVKTFSIGFEEEEFSELPYAREVARRYACDHTEFVVRPDMAAILPELAWHYGEPYADSSALPSYYVARETRKHVTVALNGDGGDELFGGYRRYRAMKAAELAAALPGPALAALSRLGGRLARAAALAGRDVPERYLGLVRHFSEVEKAGLYSPDFKRRLGAGAGRGCRRIEAAFAASAGRPIVDRLSYVDLKTYLPECLMTKIDIATMAASLEARSPLLDHELVELVFSLPAAWKVKGLGSSKWLFKETFKDLLPPSVLSRRKMGFAIPDGKWFRGPLKEFWSDHVLSARALARGYFEPRAVRALWEDHQSGRVEAGPRLWSLLMLELWHRTCLEESCRS